MHRRLGSETLSQLGFPWEGNPNFPWNKSHWDNTVVKSKTKKDRFCLTVGRQCLTVGRGLYGNPTRTLWCYLLSSPFHLFLAFILPLRAGLEASD